MRGARDECHHIAEATEGPGFPRVSYTIVAAEEG
jgi:hypothetical protein